MRWIKFRYNQILLFTLILMAILFVRLFGLTVVEGSEWAEEAQSISTKRVYSSAPRGEILDRYGRLLAANRPSFTVIFSEGNLKDEEINRQALELMNLLEQNGDSINDNLHIILNPDGSFY